MVDFADFAAFDTEYADPVVAGDGGEEATSDREMDGGAYGLGGSVG